MNSLGFSMFSEDKLRHNCMYGVKLAKADFHANTHLYICDVTT